MQREIIAVPAIAFLLLTLSCSIQTPMVTANETVATGELTVTINYRWRLVYQSVFEAWLGPETVKAYLWWGNAAYYYGYMETHGPCTKLFTRQPELDVYIPSCQWFFKTPPWTKTPNVPAGTMTYLLMSAEMNSEEVLVEDTPGSDTYHSVEPVYGLEILCGLNKTRFFGQSIIHGLGFKFFKDYPFYSDRRVKVTVDFDMVLRPRLVDVGGGYRGDLPQIPDGRVDIFDIALLARRYPWERGDPGWDWWCEELFDINNDGVIDMADIVLQAGVYGWVAPVDILVAAAIVVGALWSRGVIVI